MKNTFVTLTTVIFLPFFLAQKQTCFAAVRKWKCDVFSVMTVRLRLLRELHLRQDSEDDARHQGHQRCMHTRTHLRGILRCKCSSWSNTLWHRIRPPSRDKGCPSLDSLLMSLKKNTTLYIAVSTSKHCWGIKLGLATAAFILELWDSVIDLLGLLYYWPVAGGEWLSCVFCNTNHIDRNVM